VADGRSLEYIDIDSDGDIMKQITDGNKELKDVSKEAIKNRLKLFVRFNKELMDSIELKDENLRDIENTISNLIY